MKVRLGFGLAIAACFVVACSTNLPEQGGGAPPIADGVIVPQAGGDTGYNAPWGDTIQTMCIPRNDGMWQRVTSGGGKIKLDGDDLNACGAPGGDPHIHWGLEFVDLSGFCPCAANGSTANATGRLAEFHQPYGPANCTLANAQVVVARPVCVVDTQELANTLASNSALTIVTKDGVQTIEGAHCEGNGGATGNHQGPGEVRWHLIQQCAVIVSPPASRIRVSENAEPKKPIDPNVYCSDTTQSCPSECGAENQPTCMYVPHATGTCDDGLTPQPSYDSPTYYKCVRQPCGEVGQGCCPGFFCTGGDNVACSSDTARCQACGGSGQICCTGARCDGDLTCQQNTGSEETCRPVGGNDGGDGGGGEDGGGGDGGRDGRRRWRDGQRRWRDGQRRWRDGQRRWRDDGQRHAVNLLTRARRRSDPAFRSSPQEHRSGAHCFEMRSRS